MAAPVRREIINQGCSELDGKLIPQPKAIYLEANIKVMLGFMDLAINIIVLRIKHACLCC